MKRIGILGGMGPSATVDLFRKIVDLTDAQTDQDHIHIYIDNNPHISDRTAAIIAGNDAPVAALQLSAQQLERNGADVIIMPCNTAHFFWEQIQAVIQVPLLHMVDITAATVVNLDYQQVALLATDGTIYSRLYERAFTAQGVTMLLPNTAEQQMIMDLIYKGVKANNLSYDRQALQQLLLHLTAQGAEAFVLGCTELPLVFYQQDFSKYQLIDPTTLLAKQAIQYVGGKICE